MASELITALIGLFCTIVSSGITFILTKRKYNAEVEAQQIQNVEDAFDAYKKVVGETIETQNEKIKMLQEENKELKLHVSQLQQQLTKLLISSSGLIESKKRKK